MDQSEEVSRAVLFLPLHSSVSVGRDRLLSEVSLRLLTGQLGLLVPQLLGQGVEAGEGSEVDHAVGGLRAVLDWRVPGCGNKGTSSHSYQQSFTHVTTM